MAGWHVGSHSRASLDPAEIEAARLAAHRRRIERLEHNLRRCSPKLLRDTLLWYERACMAREAQMVRDELARRQPSLVDRLQREAAEYGRRLRIHLEDSRDRLARHLALQADLSGRDEEGVAHEAEMYERLGWSVPAAMCRLEMSRRRAESTQKEGEAW